MRKQNSNFSLNEKNHYTSRGTLWWKKLWSRQSLSQWLSWKDFRVLQVFFVWISFSSNKTCFSFFSIMVCKVRVATHSWILWIPWIVLEFFWFWNCSWKAPYFDCCFWNVLERSFMSHAHKVCSFIEVLTW